jgi:hypothetical protein
LRAVGCNGEFDPGAKTKHCQSLNDGIGRFLRRRQCKALGSLSYYTEPDNASFRTAPGRAYLGFRVEAAKVIGELPLQELERVRPADLNCRCIHSDFRVNVDTAARERLWHTFGMSGDDPKDKVDSTESKPDNNPAEKPEAPKEIGGRGGLDPTRYGDWEKAGRCIDF